MSLLKEAMEDFTILDKTSAPDGYGGKINVWKDGATIKATLVFDTSIEAQIAMKYGATSVYTLITKRDTVLEYHDVLRRESDKKIIRVTQDGDDVKTPLSSALDIRQVKCEEWKLDG